MLLCMRHLQFHPCWWWANSTWHIVVVSFVNALKPRHTAGDLVAIAPSEEIWCIAWFFWEEGVFFFLSPDVCKSAVTFVLPVPVASSIFKYHRVPLWNPEGSVLKSSFWVSNTSNMHLLCPSAYFTADLCSLTILHTVVLCLTVWACVCVCVRAHAWATAGFFVVYVFVCDIVCGFELFVCTACVKREEDEWSCWISALSGRYARTAMHAWNTQTHTYTHNMKSKGFFPFLWLYRKEQHTL